MGGLGALPGGRGERWRRSLRFASKAKGAALRLKPYGGRLLQFADGVTLRPKPAYLSGHGAFQGRNCVGEEDGSPAWPGRISWSKIKPTDGVSVFITVPAQSCLLGGASTTFLIEGVKSEHRHRLRQPLAS